ncbi:TasA family protein [Peribacillus alkalitolerans]|uniref:TasA family protein n=1 Tax=Peribacillus alkalitolerans TaxID=1550385 RepID=UPI0023DD8739|nr:TasA family protein [Peribacillus alkalitolerans]
MNIKKKLAMGALSATLGISLVAGGTWAAFNDIETVTATAGTGTLELTINPVQGPTTFSLTNLKPGDTMKREFSLKNDGSLAIKDVLFSIDSINFDDYGYEGAARDYTEVPNGADADIFGQNTAVEYLEQFKVTLARTGTEGAVEGLIELNENITLADIYKATNVADAAAITKVSAALGSHWVDGRINLASNAANQWQGLPADPRDWDNVELSILYVNPDDADNSGNADDTLGNVNAQNKFQGDSIDVNFTFEARQWQGQNVSDESGDIETNRKANNGGSN